MFGTGIHPGDENGALGPRLWKLAQQSPKITRPDVLAALEPKGDCEGRIPTGLASPRYDLYEQLRRIGKN